MTPNFLNAFGDILKNILGSTFHSTVLCCAVYQLKLRNKINVNPGLIFWKENDILTFDAFTIPDTPKNFKCHIIMHFNVLK